MMASGYLEQPAPGRAPVDAPVRGWRLGLARLLWLVMIVLAAGIFIIRIEGRFEVLALVRAGINVLEFDERLWLYRVNLSTVSYAQILILLEFIYSAWFLILGMIIARHRGNEIMPLFVSGILVAMAGLGLGPLVGRPLLMRQQWGQYIFLLDSVLWTAWGILLLTFPNGRFVPRWTRWIALLWLLWLPFQLSSWNPMIGWSSLVRQVTRGASAGLLADVRFFIVIGGTGVLAQLYRYLRVSTYIERQQTKWVLFGLSLPVIAALASYLIPMPYSIGRSDSLLRIFYSSFGVSALIIFSFLLLSLTLSLAILQYRLWDIDVVIHRTLLYSLLTASLVAIYSVSIILFQYVLRLFTNQTSQLAVVASTLIIVALFSPLRARIQNFIDRRFYRHKYDAEKTLSAFSATIRNEVELDQLTGELVAVIEETMQPSHVSLWLRADVPMPEEVSRQPA
jgi:hypothetical protein